MPTDSNPTTSRLEEPVVLLFETSPFGTLDAIVQHDGKAVYFYLNEPKTERPSVFGTRACWVRNLELGPLVLNDNEMKQGISPMLPRTHCVSRDTLPIPDAQNLKIIWLEEGNGAALVETDSEAGTSDRTDVESKTLAIIPPWSGLEGFHGYSSQSAVESPLCWPMPDNPKLRQRIEQASRFWEQWNDSKDPFAVLQPQLLAAYDKHFGADNQHAYFSIGGGKFPPRGLVRYETSEGKTDSPEEVVLATVGMSICPQPAVEIFTDDPSNHRRIELAIRIPKDRFVLDGQEETNEKLSLEKLQQNLSGLANYPWSQFTWLGPGHTCGLIGAEQGSESVLLVHDQQFSEFGTTKPIELPGFRDDPINLLWLFPIQPQQQQMLQANELTVEQFLSNQV